MSARWGRPVAVVGAVGVAVSSFLPLVRSGSATRNSYEVVAAAERLEVLTGAAATLSKGWYLVPLVAAVAWIAAVVRARTCLLVACATLLVAATALYVAVSQAPVAIMVSAAALPVAGAVAFAGAARAMWEHRQHGRRVDDHTDRDASRL